MLRALKLASWLVILGGIAVSAVRVVMALGAQEFDRVASAGLPAVLCLAGGALALVLVNAVENARTTRALGGQLLQDLCPTQPASVIGLGLLLAGAGWVVYVFLSLDAAMQAWGIIPAGPGILAALAGLILMLLSAARRPRHDR